MARKIPLIIWIPRHRPRRDPKFHQYEIEEGAGKSISEKLIILIKGWVFRIFAMSYLIERIGPLFFLITLETINRVIKRYIMM